MLVADVININPSAQPTSNDLLRYVPFFTLCFVVGSYFLEKILTARAKNKQIIREWYKFSFFDPCLVALNSYFDEIQKLTYKYVEIFELKAQSLAPTEFLKFKANISSEFKRNKLRFYNENLVPIYYNYPEIKNDSYSFLLNVEDLYIDLFGGTTISIQDFDNFLDNLYNEKGKLIKTLRFPFHYSLTYTVVKLIWKPFGYIVNCLKNI